MNKKLRIGIGIVVVCAIVTVAMFTGCIEEETATPTVNAKNMIEVNHEWGKLKEVIVGIGEDLVIPGYSESVSFIYDPTYLDLMKEYGGRNAMDVDPETTKEVIEQINGLAKVLEDRGVIVHRTHRLTKPEENEYLEDVQKGCMFLYARDPILVIGNNVIETAIKIPMRAKERYAIRPILKERLKSGNANYVAVPAVSPAFGEEGIYLEGGDVLLNGYEIYVGNSGRGSNKAGIEWLQNYLGPKYKVHEIKISQEFEHLDCVLSLPCPGLGVICKEAILSELPESIRDWDFIEVSVAEAKKLGANLFVLDEKTCIVDNQHHRIAEELRQRGQEVIEIPYDKVATWGGGFRCSHHPLRRESKLE
ncbi:MAG: hypothetical protein KAT65_07775 [Methanophagales archaeon]|nr:hypothetical protein [Methanophagales archaeon]